MAVLSLSAAIIKQFLNANCCFKPENILVFNEIDSTNSYLLSKLTDNPNLPPHICTADYQTAGRGRLNRKWVTPAAKSIAVSFSYHFTELDSRILPQLAILVAFVVAEVVTSLGAKVKLKWPNDLYANECKLAGILIETAAITPQSCNVVIGIGINYEQADYTEIKQPVTYLSALLPVPLPTREFIIANLANRLSKYLPLFVSHGIKVFYSSWTHYDLLLGRRITAYLPDGVVISGIGNGLNCDGTYRLVLDNRNQIMLSFGEVSIRLPNED